MRNLSTGILTGWQANEAEKTDFAALVTRFRIAKVQAQTADLKLLGPIVRMSGAGTVDLPAQTLKLKVDPQVVASLEGQGGRSDVQGLGVPVIIAGSCEALDLHRRNPERFGRVGAYRSAAGHGGEPHAGEEGQEAAADARSERAQAAEAAAKQGLQSLFGN